MPRSGWRSTVRLGGKSYTGDGRSTPENAMPAAARAALEALGQPFKSQELSNSQAEDALVRYCQQRCWDPPSYSIDRCMYTPQHTGGGGGRRKPVQIRLKCAEVKIGEQWFAGEGSYGIEDAKAAAARCALKEMGQASVGLSNEQVLVSLIRFCTSQGLGEPVYTLYSGSSVPQRALPPASKPENSIGTLDDIAKRFQSQEPKLCVLVGYDNGRQKGNQWDVVCSVSVGEASQQFSGRASSKQDAKEQAAHKAYKWLSEQLQGPVPAHTDLDFAAVTSKQGALTVDANCMDALRQVCHNLMEPLQDDVVAAILMTQDDPGNKAEVVSIGSGTGFIYQQNLVADGKAIFDCHAEVLARRGLEAYLFSQIESALKGLPQSIVRKVGGKYHLNEGVRFHLFVSKVPCGDACVPLKAKNAGCLRYRKDDGEGDLLKPEGDPRHYKMCCSAKIALWNVVGVQGALLAQLLDRPVYLSTIIVKGAADGHKDDHVCEGSLQQAFFGRLKGVQGLPDKYRVNEPTVVVMPSDGGAQGKGGDSKHLAFTWTAGTQKEEMIETPTGLRKSGDLDVSKRGSANYWASLCPRDVGKEFHVVKQGAKDYQIAKKKFEACFPKSEWIHKSPKFDSFQV